MRLIFLCWVVMAFLFCPLVANASTDSARARSIYFTAISDGSDDGTCRMYAKHWRVWLQLHRAIEKKADLAKKLKRKPAHYNSDKGRSFSWIHQHLPASFLAARSTHIYILQLAAFDQPQSLKNFMTGRWPNAARKAIYAQTPKDFYVGFSNEAASKSDPLFVLRESIKGHSMLRLNYGIYASIKDAERDKARFQKTLGISPLIRQTFLTPRIARAFINDSVAGRLPGKGAKGFSLAW